MKNVYSKYTMLQTSNVFLASALTELRREVYQFIEDGMHSGNPYESVYANADERRIVSIGAVTVIQDNGEFTVIQPIVSEFVYYNGYE